MTVDAPDYIIEYASELLDVEFNSILIGGLGIGVIPYVVQDFAEVDVIENDENIIDIVAQLNHLNENVNIIKGDIFTFDVAKTYDVIVLDIWYEALTEELSNQLIEKYLPFVNEGGFLYIPINARVLDNKVKMIKSSSNQ
jgi:16S rRNA A1518/A1519 N6-dimethyltransferase RsmA/KsgA/DIM1 with predicted DNA glycosylase/AP lyase activity